jgi:S-DNA-T family DNA segregation ATPase FtsK/SpoIIIE
MATTEFEEKPRVITPRNSRLNEIVAISLLAMGLLFTLCLVSAAFYPNDPSWNAAGQVETRNWAGAIGANVAAFLFQSVGLAAYLLPVLLFGAAWRRFKTRSFRAPFSRLLGLVVLTLATAALLSISGIQPIFDSSVEPGGLIGTVISRGLASGLNAVGATVLLIAIAATGFLLATNFSFIELYQ